MGYRYGHKTTAFNGVWWYIQKNYPDSWVNKSTKDGIPLDAQHCRFSTEGFNKFMSAYRLSRGSNPSKDYFKNASYIQKDFKPFMEYCKQELK